MSEWQSAYSGKTVLITGCCGTVGAELVKQLLSLGTKKVLGIDISEELLFYQQVEYKDEPRYTNRYVDIRSPDQIESAFSSVDIVIHAAALKQVPVCEEAPNAAVDVNISGVQNIIRSARINNVERVLFTSSDKAVNPTNVMGTSKLMGERLITAANIGFSESSTIFSSTRFGNVAGSRGSVIPVFQKQIMNKQSMTLTTSRMTRFMMTNEEACRLVLQSCIIAKGGEVFVTKMPVIGILQLAEVLRDRLCPVYGHSPDEIDIIEIGARPGEKDYEELTTHEEIRRTRVGDDMLIVSPAYSVVYPELNFDYDMDLEPSTEEYNSDKITHISNEELNDLLTAVGVPKA